MAERATPPWATYWKERSWSENKTTSEHARFKMVNFIKIRITLVVWPQPDSGTQIYDDEHHEKHMDNIQVVAIQ